MADQLTPERDLGKYFALAQTGLGMVAPIVAGVYLDKYLGWSPWATAAGAVLGLTGGLAHLIWMVNRQERKASQAPKDKS